VPLLLYSNDIRIKHGVESKKSFCGVGVNLQGPVNFVTLRCVTPVLRPLSMAMSTVVIHVFGDVPSAPIVGAFQDWLQNWRLTTLGLTCIFFLATAIWASGIAIAPRNGDRGIEVTPDLHQPGSKSQEAPLLTNE
jgi:hypothetical protein